MWKIRRIKAKNICSFETLELEPVQGEATLIFGQNMDSDSQNSNGSGKSALIESLAVGLTGEPLRKVGQDEIINDNYDEARIVLELSNQELGKAMVIDRIFRRKKPQEVHLDIINNGDQFQNFVLSTVNDYNAYIMEQLGITRDDLYSNYILTARRYKSFLTASDTDKKALINRLSNANLIDEAISMVRIELDEQTSAEVKQNERVAALKGAIETLAAEIDLQKQADKRAEEERVRKIAELQKLIEDKESGLSSSKVELEESRKRLEGLKSAKENIRNFEVGKDICKLVKNLNAELERAGIPKNKFIDYTPYAKKSLSYKDNISYLNAELERMQANLESWKARFEQLKTEENDANRRCQEFNKKADERDKERFSESAHLEVVNANCESNRRQSWEELSKVEAEISRCNVRAAGIVECPQCHHHFSPSEDTPEKIQSDLKFWTDQKIRLTGEIGVLDKLIKENKAKIKEMEREHRDLLNSRAEIAYYTRQACEKRVDCSKTVENIESQIERIQMEIKIDQDSLDNMALEIRKVAFSLTVEDIDYFAGRKSSNEYRISSLEWEITNAKVRLEALQQPADTSRIDDMQDRLEALREKFLEAHNGLEFTKGLIGTHKSQMALFEEFKTYVANTKVGAISKITNDFLEAIGSDIRLSLSGYTVLKSGKVRDKISASLLRDGKDCGSYDKFSAGERCRVELACILAMHSLINKSAKGGGLDILVLDEILDASDETGLASVFKALNDTGVTSLVISHGNISEGYRNRLTVYKENGVSHL